MTSIERVDAVLRGERPDRVPFSFWYHFNPDQVSGEAGLRAHLEILDQYGVDFLKIMNDNTYPHPAHIQHVDDLKQLKPLSGDEDGFGQQLKLISDLKAKAGGRVRMATTIFNAWATLRLLVRKTVTHSPPNLDASADQPSRWIRQAFLEAPELLTAALNTIAQNLGRFAQKCLAAGADGIYLSVREDWVDTPEILATHPNLYHRLVTPGDEVILRGAAAGKFNILHVCGKPLNLRALSGYPNVAVLHWADRSAGPPISQVVPWAKCAVAGGVDNLGTLVSGTPDQIRGEVLDAISQAQGHPLLIAPGCTFDPNRVPAENLRALADAAKETYAN